MSNSYTLYYNSAYFSYIDNQSFPAVRTSVLTEVECTTLSGWHTRCLGQAVLQSFFPSSCYCQVSNKVYANYKVCNNHTCKNQYIHITGTHETAKCVVPFTWSFELTLKWLSESFQCSPDLITIFKMSACCACVLSIP